MEAIGKVMTRLLLVDLDGTIREPLSGSRFIQHPQDQKIIKGADKALAHYHVEGWVIVGVTNQGGVAAGHKSLSDCFDEQRYTLELFPQISAIYLCPDYDGWSCWVVERCQLPTESREFGYEGRHFRKPGAGMLKFALWQYGISHLKAFYIGDRPEDESAASGAGVQYMDADIWRERFSTL